MAHRPWLVSSLLLLWGCSSADPVAVRTPTAEERCGQGKAIDCVTAADDAFGDKPKVVALLTRSCELDPRRCVKAAELVRRTSDSTYVSREATRGKALELVTAGCRAHDGDSCAAASHMLLHAGRCSEVPPLLADACAAHHPGSCRELAKIAILGCAEHSDLSVARARLDESCTAADAEACFLSGFLALSGREGPPDRERARKAFSTGCSGKIECISAWDRAPSEKSTEIDDLAIIRSQSPITVEHLGPAPVPYSLVTLSVMGPFVFGSVSIGSFGVAGGAAFDVDAQRFSFHDTSDFRIQTEWGIGDLVSVGWRAPKQAKTQADCDADYEAKRGFATLANGACVRASATDCARTEECLADGHCGWKEGMCIATDEGCHASTACKSRGACRLGNGFCTP